MSDDSFRFQKNFGFRAFLSGTGGSLAPYIGIALLPLMVVATIAVEYTEGQRVKSRLQNALDGAVLTGASGEEKVAEATDYFNASFPEFVDKSDGPVAEFALGEGVLDATARWQSGTGLGSALFGDLLSVSVRSQARFADEEPGGPCITVLANSGQALLVNSGANIQAPSCEIHVHSTQDPAFIMNAGSTLNLAKLCVKGTKYIKNGGTISKLETNCAVAADPYFTKIPEPAVSPTCTTSGAKDGASHTLNPGVHCWVNFNGSPTVTFKPGLHIIKGPMNINSGSTVIADGVTFYFPDTDSKIQANGSLKMSATAPTTGTYSGVLMFEKTSNASNNANKRQYVFNGSTGEYLEGLIYLPNRDVTYNSTTNVKASKVTMLVNTMILNSANWTFEGAGGGGSGSASSIVLSR
ncbi:MAG: pilus assembly protein TadG-related protein [Mesorhizobium sp.]|nr:pilus assembly protein TadG-related protein [Mesorhizobium sp.]MCO5163849.1 pilus assembly protein TadG-related protein [Mesorhizobium sp.]